MQRSPFKSPSATADHCSVLKRSDFIRPVKSTIIARSVEQ